MLQPLSDLTGKEIAARADEYDAGKEEGDGDDAADSSEDGIITCKAMKRIGSHIGNDNAVSAGVELVSRVSLMK